MSTYIRRNAIRFVAVSILLSLFLTGTLIFSLAALNTNAKSGSSVKVSAPTSSSLYPLPKSPSPASTFYVAGSGGITSPLGYSLAALQGIVARNQPQIFITYSSQDQAWLQYIQKTYGVNVQKSSALQLIQQFKSYVTDSSGNIKIIVFASNDALFPMQVNIATTLAGVYTALPVASNDLSTIKSIFGTKITILYDLTGKFTDKVSGYSWLWNLVGSQVTRQFVVMAPEGKVPLTDYIVEFKAFDFEICCVSAGQKYTLTSSEQSFVNLIFSNYAPLTPVLGFFGLGGESGTINYLSQHGMSALSSDEAADLSVYSGFPDATNLQQVPENRITYNPSKVYVLWQFTQGDALMYDYYNNYAQWLAIDPATNQPYRNEIAATWQLNPAMAELAPPILKGWYDTQSALDDFITGPSGGAGYAHPDNMPNEAAFLNQVAALTANADMGVHFVILQSLSTSVYQNYINYAHPTAILLWQNNGRASQIVNGVPVMTSSFWESAGYSYVPTDVTTAVSQIQGSGKFVYVIMNAQNPGFPFIKAAMNQLGSGYVAVSAGQYTGLYLQSMGVTTSSSSTHSTTTQSSTTSHTTSTTSPTTTHSTSTSSSTTTSHSTTATSSTSTSHSTSTTHSTSATSSTSSTTEATSSTSKTTSSGSTSTTTSPSTSTTNSTSSSITTPTTSETSNSGSSSVSTGSTSTDLTSTTITSSVDTQPNSTTTQASETTSQASGSTTTSVSASVDTSATSPTASTTQNTTEHSSQSSRTTTSTQSVASSVTSSVALTTSSTPNRSVSVTTTAPFRTGNGISAGSLLSPSRHQPAALIVGSFAAFGVFFVGRMPLKALLKREDGTNELSVGWHW